VMRAARRFLRDRGGATAIEFAVVSIPLVLIFVGTIEFGRVFYIRNDLAQAADKGMRILLVDPTAGLPVVIATVEDAFRAGPDSALDISLGAGPYGTQKLTVRYPVTLLIPGFRASPVTLSVERALP